jgi:hypothetical protein
MARYHSLEGLVERLERFLIGTVVGLAPPVLALLAGWWAALPLPESLVPLAALAGLPVGIALDIAFLRRWVTSAYTAHLAIWVGLYLFYAVGVFGLFMGVPVFNVLPGIPAGLLLGARLANRRASRAEVQALSRRASGFTTGVLAIACLASAALALFDPYTAANLAGMLGLAFEVTRGMVVGLILVGGSGLLALQWWLTGMFVKLAYRFLWTSGEPYITQD